MHAAAGREPVVMVVEDEPDIREAFREFLIDEGYEVHTAEHGKAALEQLERVPRPCAILLDLMMPVMDGWRFLKERQGMPELRGIPVVTVSASQQHAEGADVQLPKPVDLDALLSTIAKLCERPPPP